MRINRLVDYMNWPSLHGKYLVFRRTVGYGFPAPSNRNFLLWYNLLGGENVVVLSADEKTVIEGYEVYTVASYNVGKQFHTKDMGYLGYLVKIEDQIVYVAGDCDMNEDNLRITPALNHRGVHVKRIEQSTAGTSEIKRHCVLQS